MIARNNFSNQFSIIYTSGEYLNLSSDTSVHSTQPIIARNKAIKKSLQLGCPDYTVEVQGSSDYQTIKELIVQLQNQKTIPQLSGFGLEMGAGSALFSIGLLANDVENLIHGIFALEATPAFAESAISLARDTYLPSRRKNLIPCLGNFENVDIESGSLDFVIQFEAFHHADNLDAVHKEAARLLRSGGILVSIDRSWPNSIARETLEELLDHRYPNWWLERKGFPSDRTFTRRMNGEHEITDIEWERSISFAGLVITKRQHMQPRLPIIQILKSFLCSIGLRKLLRIRLPRRSGTICAQITHMFNLGTECTHNVRIWKHPRELTVFILKKE